MAKSDVKKFFEWFRNGVAFATTWFLILLLLRNYIYGVEQVDTGFLIKMIVSVAGGVLLFCTTFLQVVIKKWKFETRLTVFMVVISLYECVCFYWMGIFKNRGTLLQYGVFVGIVMVCYLVCMVIYKVYCKRQGELYTEALQRYQQN